VGDVGGRGDVGGKLGVEGFELVGEVGEKQQRRERRVGLEQCVEGGGCLAIACVPAHLVTILMCIWNGMQCWGEDD
jgi:hypothetical protein